MVLGGSGVLKIMLFDFGLGLRYRREECDGRVKGSGGAWKGRWCRYHASDQMKAGVGPKSGQLNAV